MTDTADFLNENAGDFNPAFKFATPGDTIKGTIVGAPRIVDGEDLNGRPQKSLVVDIEADDGTWAVWLPSGKGVTRAVAKAAKEAGAAGVAEGGTLAIRYTGDGEPSKPGFNPPKLFEARYTPPAPSSVDLDEF